MKISIKIIIVSLIMLQFVGCDSETIYKDEHYKNLVYLLSKGNENVFIASYTLNEENPVQYVTVGCGGSNTNEKQIVVNIEPNPEMLDQYNKINYDYESQYAKLLPESHYEIPSYTVTIPARSNYHYQRMNVVVKPNGLSPDSVYFIPLKIVSVSEYEVNEEKQDVLFRVTIENDYATQYPQTYYRKSGQMTNPLVVMSGTKLVHPLEKDKVRMFIGNELYNDDTTPNDIANKSVVVQINADSTVIVSPYDSSVMEVEMLSEAPGYNRYNPSLVQGLTKQRVLWLNYQFRQKNATTGVFGAWRKVEERLIRIEE